MEEKNELAKDIDKGDPSGRRPARRLGAFRERVLLWDPEKLNTGWEDLLVAEGLSLLGSAFADIEALDWVDRWLSYHLGVDIVEEELFIPSYTTLGVSIRGIKLYDYCGNWGLPLAAVSRIEAADSSREAYEKAIRRVSDYIIDHSPRGPEGVIRHGGFTRGVWVDTIYYTALPLAKAYSLTGEERYAWEAMKQARLHARYLQDPRTALFFHDFDPERKIRTPGLWSRGNGWALIGLGEVLERLDPSLPGYDEVRSSYLSLVDAILPLRDSTGMWRIVPDNRSSHLETSGTTMFCLGLSIGIAAGLLDPSLMTLVHGSFQELVSWIEVEAHPERIGALMGCEEAAGVGGWEVHKTVPLGETTFGTGLFLKLIARLQQMGMDIHLSTLGRERKEI